MSKKEKLKHLYNRGLELRKQLDAVEMSTKFITSKEMGAFYTVKAEAEARLEANNEEFDKAVDEFKND